MRFILVVIAILATAVSTPAQGKHFLWKVEAPNGATAYLLGSVHVLTADSYPLPGAIDKAFAESKTLVEEVDLDEMSDPSVMIRALGNAMLTDGKTLDQIIAPPVYAEVSKRAQSVGLPMMALDRMKPWLVAVTLMAPTLQAAGYKPEFGVDRHFFDRAKEKGLKRQALETIAYQLDRFDSMPLPVQEALLKATIEDLDTQVTAVKDMVRAWSVGDLAALERFTLTAFKESPELYQRLLVERNHNWVPHVEKCLSDKAGCFVVVGAAHLVGSDGLPALLSKKGLKVTQQ
jgi:uncharacterized protein